MRAPIFLVFALALALGACGDSDEDKIKSLLEAQGGQKNPDVCSAASDSLVAQTSFGSGAVARDKERFCRANIAVLAPDKIVVSRVDVDGDTAEAQFAPEGGQLVFDDATIALRKRDGRWRTERLTAMQLNRANFEQTSVLQLTSGKDALPASSRRCFVRRTRLLSDEEIERGVVKAEPGFMVDATVNCALVPELRRQNVPEARVRCLARGLLRRDAGRVMQIIIGEGSAAEARARRLFRNVLKFCP